MCTAVPMRMSGPRRNGFYVSMAEGFFLLFSVYNKN
jgi:hypothetical protein